MRSCCGDARGRRHYRKAREGAARQTADRLEGLPVLGKAIRFCQLAAAADTALLAPGSGPMGRPARSSSVWRRPAGYCFVPSERVRVNGGAAPGLPKAAHVGARRIPCFRRRVGMPAEPAYATETLDPKLDASSLLRPPQWTRKEPVLTGPLP